MTEKGSGMESDGEREFEARVEANLTLLHQGVKGIGKRLDERKMPPDHGESIGALAKKATDLIEGVRRLEASEALKSDPKAHARMMDKAAARVAMQGRENVQAACEELRKLTACIDGTRQRARDAHDQNVRNWEFAAGGILVSAMLWFLATAYFFDPEYSIWPYRAMKPDSLWDVGADFLKADNPEGFRRASKALAIYTDNSEAFAKCEDAARRLGTPVSCQIVVPAPK